MVRADVRDAALVLFDSLPDPAAVMEPLGGDVRLVRVNAAGAAWLDRDVADLAGRRVSEVVADVAVAELAGRVRDAIGSGEVTRYEVARELPTDRVVVEVTLVPVGRWVVGVVRDVSREREAVRAIDELEELAGIGTWRWDPSNDHLEWSVGYRRVCGLPVDAAPSMDLLLGRVHPDDLDGLRVRLEAVGAGEEAPTPFEFRVIHPDGSVRELEGRGRAAHGPDGRLVRLFGTVQDVTVRRGAERRQAQLRSAELRYRQAVELNDDVVQGLAGAWLALELGRVDEATELVHRTTRSAQALIGELLAGSDGDRSVTAGDLARRRPADVARAEQRR